MVFLIGGRGGGIDHARIGQRLVLAHQRGAGDLGDHQPRLQARRRRKEGGQPETQGRIDQQGDAPLGDGADFRNGDGDTVCRHADGFRVEIAARHDGAVAQHQRVVGRGIGLDPQDFAGMRQLVETGADHLRCAAQAIGVLHAQIVFAVAFADLRSVEQVANDLRRHDLAAMAAQAVDLVMKRRGRTHRRIERQRRGDERIDRQPPAVEQRGKGQSGGHLRAVEQREPFLGFEHERFEACALQGRARRHAFAPVEGVAFPDQGGGDMGQRGKIARCADRSLFRDHGGHASLDQLLQPFDNHGPDPGCPAPQRKALERDDEAHDLRIERRSEARAVRKHQIALERAEIGFADAHAGELAEAGVDAVDRLARAERRAEAVGRSGHGIHRRLVDPEGAGRTVQFLDLRQPQRTGRQFKHRDMILQ